MTETQRTAAAIGKRVGIPVVIVLALINAAVQLWMYSGYCRRKPTALRAVDHLRRMDRLNPGKLETELQDRYRAIEGTTPDLEADTVAAVLAEIRNGDRAHLATIYAECNDQEDTGEYPAVTT